MSRRRRAAARSAPVPVPVVRSAGAAGLACRGPEPVGRADSTSAGGRIGFSARHAMITKVRGSFNEFEGKARGG
ncbi:hypothetical protein [Yinghuangia sp. YIM S10712]|uniref:hypothetical protein n=1 Tax=Yinghuangia sp. YIM S10712 TaxID=3436930 RepID=UPI003F52DBCD